MMNDDMTYSVDDLLKLVQPHDMLTLKKYSLQAYKLALHPPFVLAFNVQEGNWLYLDAISTRSGVSRLLQCVVCQSIIQVRRKMALQVFLGFRNRRCRRCDSLLPKNRGSPHSQRSAAKVLYRTYREMQRAKRAKVNITAREPETLNTFFRGWRIKEYGFNQDTIKYESYYVLECLKCELAIRWPMDRLNHIWECRCNNDRSGTS